MEPRTTSGEDVIGRLLDGIEAGSLPAGVFSEDAVLDATVPNWRFTVEGGEAVEEQLGGWYADPGQFLSIRRLPLPDGEMVEFTLSWVEAGVAHACHQGHLLTVKAGRIVSDTAWCGGRWPASLLEEMGPQALV